MASPSSTPRVAIVHGNPVERAVVARAIRGYYVVSEYDGGTVAWKEFQRNRPSVIIVDEMITPCGGSDFVTSLRCEKQFQEIPVLIISSLCAREIRNIVMSCGASGYLPRPCSAKTAIKTISAVLNRAVEKRWEVLPKTERAALKETLNVLNAIPEALATNTPLNYDHVKTSCEPLVELVYRGNVRSVLEAVKEHDNYTFAHSFKVGTMLAMFGSAIGLSLSDQQLLACGGLLHDAGKMSIPLEVLNKPGRLTEDEFKVMKSHVAITMEFLGKSGGVPKGALIIAGQHHEKMDGSGYPNGIKGNELNELARMASIVDIYGALTDRRVYKEGMPPEKALTIMTEEMTNHIDQGLVKMFRQAVLDTAK